MSRLRIGDRLKRNVEQDDAYSMFKYFEPWDVEPRSQEIIDLAKKDDVDLFCEDYIQTGNIAPHPFQSGYLLSTKRIRALVGPTQGGKSLPVFIEIGIMCSGELPISLQYNKGVDTGIERVITTENIRRWGRFDIKTGHFLDKDEDAERDGSWNCGNIVGAGKYPKDKIIPKRITEEAVERTIWIGTTKKALDESWWPKLTGGVTFPEKFIDRTKGNKGTNQSDGKHLVHLINNVRLSLISYESGFKAFEAVTVWACFFDEESTDRACFTAALGHCKYFATQMTPYNGVTYTREVLFKPNPEIDIFHATAYDSPYITAGNIALYRKLYPEHEQKARIWGEHTAESKTPYYDQHKLKSWIKQMKESKVSYPRAVFMPKTDYFGIKRAPRSEMPGLMEIDVNMLLVDEEECVDGKNESGHNTAWTILEERREDCAYFVPSDAANGADVPDYALDFQGTMIMRPPMEKGELFPVIVAYLQTTCTPDVHAKLVGLALNYYNWALLCAESANRGAANGMFYSEMQDYPHWLETTYQRSGTSQYLTNKGLDNKAGTRKDLFDGIEKVFGTYSGDDPPPVKCLLLLEQAQECQKIVKSGGFRPDHPRNKTNDMLMCYAIGLFVWKHFSDQVKCRRKSEEKLDIAPKDSVLGLLERKKRSQKQADPYFPSNRNGARR